MRSYHKTIDHYIREFIDDIEKRHFFRSFLFLFFNNDNDGGNNSSTDAVVPFSVSWARWLSERRGCFALCQARLPQENGGGILPREISRKFAPSYPCSNFRMILTFDVPSFSSVSNSFSSFVNSQPCYFKLYICTEDSSSFT